MIGDELYLLSFADWEEEYPVAVFTDKSYAVKMMGELQPNTPLDGHIEKLKLNPSSVAEAFESLDYLWVLKGKGRD